MTARIPLFDFMPYGAPELMSAYRRHMLRGLMTSCALVIALFATLLLILPRLPEVARVEMPSVIIDGPVNVTIPRDPIRPSDPPRVKVSTQQKFGGIVPVRDELLDENRSFAEFDYGLTTQQEEGSIGSEQTTGLSIGAGTGEELPERGVYVFHDEAPVAIVTPTFYPEFAREAGIEGRVLVHILIGKDGHVLRAELDAKIHDPALDEAALESVKQWVFTPAMANGHPVAVWDTVPFVFTLH